MRAHSRSCLFLILAALGAPLPASAIGDVTCETPAIAGVVAIVPLTADPADDVALAKVAQASPLGVVRAPELGGGESTQECIVGPLPPLDGIQGGTGDTPTQAYVEHGLSENASWRGFRFELALPSNGIPDGGRLTVVAVEFDTAAGNGDQYRVAVQRTGATTELVLLRAGVDAPAARLPVGAGDVALSWANDALTITHAGASDSAPLAAGSRARAVRLGFLGVDAPQSRPTEVYVVDPAFTAD